jgi:hypothetical protein
MSPPKKKPGAAARPTPTRTAARPAAAAAEASPSAPTAGRREAPAASGPAIPPGPRSEAPGNPGSGNPRTAGAGGSDAGAGGTTGGKSNGSGAGASGRAKGGGGAGASGANDGGANDGGANDSGSKEGGAAGGSNDVGSKEGGAKATGPRPTARASTPRTATAARGTGPRARGTGPGARGNARPAARGAGRDAQPTPALVVGAISPLTRLAGALAVLSAVLLLVQPAWPLVRDGGRGLGGAHNVWDFVVWLPAAAMVGAAGVLCLRGRLPRLGLAVLIAAGGFGPGLLIRALALLDTAGHSSIDLPLPEGLVRSFRYTAGPGLVAQIVALAGLSLVLVLALVGWRRTDMDDDHSFDPLRPTFGALGFAAALVGFGALAFPPAVPRPGGLTITVPSLFERSGLDLLGGWLIVAAVTVAAAGAATVRPRLAVVGMFAGLAAVFATLGLGNLLLVIRSTALDIDTGTAMQLVAALVFAGLAGTGWRITRRPAAVPD